MRSEGYRDVVMCSVDITMTTGQSYSGIIERPRAKRLADLMNDATSFIEIELYDGSVKLLSKRSILSCESNDVPKADQLAMAIRRADVYHPLGVLGIDSVTTRDSLRQAYHTRVRVYHADQFASVQLPAEVAAYLEDMTRRLNSAYKDSLAMLERQEAEAAQAARAAKGFTRNVGTPGKVDVRSSA